MGGYLSRIVPVMTHYLTTGQAATSLGASASSLRRWSQDPSLPDGVEVSQTAGGHLRWSAEGVEILRAALAAGWTSRPIAAQAPPAPDLSKVPPVAEKQKPVSVRRQIFITAIFATLTACLVAGPHLLGIYKRYLFNHELTDRLAGGNLASGRLGDIGMLMTMALLVSAVVYVVCGSSPSSMHWAVTGFMCLAPVIVLVGLSFPGSGYTHEPRSRLIGHQQSQLIVRSYTQGRFTLRAGDQLSVADGRIKEPDYQCSLNPDPACIAIKLGQTDMATLADWMHIVGQRCNTITVRSEGINANVTKRDRAAVREQYRQDTGIGDVPDLYRLQAWVCLDGKSIKVGRAYLTPR